MGLHLPIHEWLQHYGVAGVFFILTVEMIGMPFPAETTLTVAGMGLLDGTFRFIPLFLAAVLGNLLGSTIAYAIGWKVGRAAILRVGKYVGITERRLYAAEQKMNRYRVPLLLLSKFIAGVRVFVPYLAGINRLPFRSFVLYNAVAATLWVLTFLLLGRYIHMAWRKYHMLLHGGLLIAVLAAAVAAAVFVLMRRYRRRARV